MAAAVLDRVLRLQLFTLCVVSFPVKGAGLFRCVTKKNEMLKRALECKLDSQ